MLDSKNPAMQALIERAPRLYDDLDEDSLKHFEELQAILRSLGLDYEINPRLVRGLDYYNHTVFEWVTDRLGRAGRGVRGRPLRRPDRAARRQAGAGLRLRDGRRAACSR